MTTTHATTAVIVDDNSTEKRLSAWLTDEQEMVIVELDNKEIFRMDYENFEEWTNLVKEQKV